MPFFPELLARLSPSIPMIRFLDNSIDDVIPDEDFTYPTGFPV